MNINLVLNSLLLGVGLAMDAFSVSVADGLANPGMKKTKMTGIAGTFALFQFAMPMIGWLLVHTIAEKFTMFTKFIPFIALGLLLFIGIKMIVDALKSKDNKEESPKDTAIEMAGEEKVLSLSTLMLQGIATSIDALSVGFTTAEYKALTALGSAGIIGIVTFIICIFGLAIGRKIGIRFSQKAGIFGGIILIAIGIKIFVEGVILH